MADPLPEGCISLVEAFQAHFNKRYDEKPSMSVGDISDRHKTIWDDMISEFSARGLEAYYRIPGSDENKRIQPETWSKAFFPERIFMEQVVPFYPETDPWSELSGRIPFVKEKEFLDWSKNTTTKNAGSTPPNKYEIEDVVAWFCENLREPFLADSGPRVTRDKWDEMAQTPFPGITTTLTRRVFKDHAPKGWKTTGRPPGSKNKPKP